MPPAGFTKQCRQSISSTFTKLELLNAGHTHPSTSPPVTILPIQSFNLLPTDARRRPNRLLNLVVARGFHMHPPHVLISTQEMSCIIAGPLQAMKEPETPRCFPHSVIGVTYSRRREVKGLCSRRLHEELTLVLVLQLGACLRYCSMLGLVCNLSLLFARNLLALATRSLESD